MNLVASGNHIFVSAGDVAHLLAKRNCKLQLVTVPDIFVENESFIFRKKDPRLPQINRTTITAFNFISHVDEKYDRKAQESDDCSHSAEDSSYQNRSLDITRLSGTLFLLLTGSGCAICVFVMENCVSHLRDRHVAVA